MYGFKRGTDSSGTQFDVVFNDTEKGDLKIKFPDGFHAGNRSNPNEECEKYLNLFDRDTLQVALQELEKEHPGVIMVSTPKHGKEDKESFNLSTVAALSALVDKLEEKFKDSFALAQTEENHKKFLGDLKFYIDSAIEAERKSAVTLNSAQQKKQKNYKDGVQYRANKDPNALEKLVSVAPATLASEQKFTIPPPRQPNMISQMCTAAWNFCCRKNADAAVQQTRPALTTAINSANLDPEPDPNATKKNQTKPN